MTDTHYVDTSRQRQQLEGSQSILDERERIKREEIAEQERQKAIAVQEQAEKDGVGDGFRLLCNIFLEAK